MKRKRTPNPFAFLASKMPENVCIRAGALIGVLMAKMLLPLPVLNYF